MLDVRQCKYIRRAPDYALLVVTQPAIGVPATRTNVVDVRRGARAEAPRLPGINPGFLPG